MRVLGVDPGSRAAGWAVVDFGPGSRLEGSGVLRPGTSLPLPARLAALHEGLRAVIERYRPDGAAVERVFAGVNPQSLITLGESRGVLLLALVEAGIPVQELTPAEIKKSVTGTGLAEKEQVRRMVVALLGPLPPGARLPLDAADAAAAALAWGAAAVRGCSPAAPLRTVSGGGTAVRRRPSG